MNNEKLMQRFIVGCSSNSVDELVELIKNYKIGGVILYRKNYTDLNSLNSVINRLKEANRDNPNPLFISIDQEGGRVNRIPSEIINIKNVHEMSLKDKSLIYKSACITGNILSELGINMNFAPVLDKYENINNKCLYKRCFTGSDIDITKCGIDYVKGMHENGIISVIKHFPGHGLTKRDSHIFAPYIKNNDKMIEHLEIFDSVIASGVDGVMVGHLVIKDKTYGLPASICDKFLKENIRDRYKFDGLIISDEINMLSRDIRYRFRCLRNVINSDSDIILIKCNGNGKRILDKAIKISNKDNVDSSKNYDRIVSIKKKYNINDREVIFKMDIDKVNEKIKEINDRCL